MATSVGTSGASANIKDQSGVQRNSNYANKAALAAAASHPKQLVDMIEMLVRTRAGNRNSKDIQRNVAWAPYF